MHGHAPRPMGMSAVRAGCTTLGHAARCGGMVYGVWGLCIATDARARAWCGKIAEARMRHGVGVGSRRMGWTGVQTRMWRTSVVDARAARDWRGTRQVYEHISQGVGAGVRPRHGCVHPLASH